VRFVVLIVLSACGRLGFDAPGTASDDDDATGDGGRDGAASTADGFVRGDVLFTNNVAFVSAATITPGTLGGVAPADAACQAEADAAGLAGTYVAWLSTSTTNAIDRLGTSRGWVRSDGAPFVDTVADLAAGRLYLPLSVDVNGVALPQTAVFTGTLSDGTADPFTCGDLSSTSDLMAYGISTSTWGTWTRINASFSDCGSNVRIYCFGTGTTNPIVIPQVPSRRAFLSDVWTPGSGIASADTQCQQSATNAGLTSPSSFRALLATTSASAASRFVDGLPWARRDGLLVAPTAQDLLAGAWQVPLALDATGAHMTDIGPAWTGADTFTATATTDCSDWSVSNNGADGLGLGYNVIPLGTATTSACGSQRRLFCLEQ
jgi:hypothetical protein